MALEDDQTNLLAELANIFTKQNGKIALLEAENAKLRRKAGEPSTEGASGPTVPESGIAGGLLTLIEDVMDKAADTMDRILDDNENPKPRKGSSSNPFKDILRGFLD